MGINKRKACESNGHYKGNFHLSLYRDVIYWKLNRKGNPSPQLGRSYPFRHVKETMRVSTQKPVQ